MPGKNLEFGKQAEDAAVKFLKVQGYKIIRRNYKTKFGEIDIIAEDKGVICFVEVKARHSKLFGGPGEAVSPLKQRQISKVAICYLKENNFLEHSARFDVVSLLYAQDLPEIDLIKDAFELSSDFTI
ncbi:MAG: YraN family protein [Candidatus Omnitrophica bacterium]|nr:YraN family protein [Candidatus Omnitrophota bacterium]MBU1923644.1 YraN family protein [Candidatus Omnitrophota bacterium]